MERVTRRKSKMTGFRVKKLFLNLFLDVKTHFFFPPDALSVGNYFHFLFSLDIRKYFKGLILITL